jgi:hypothetical protein
VAQLQALAVAGDARGVIGNVGRGRGGECRRPCRSVPVSSGSGPGASHGARVASIVCCVCHLLQYSYDDSTSEFDRRKCGPIRRQKNVLLSLLSFLGRWQMNKLNGRVKDEEEEMIVKKPSFYY